MTKLKPNQFILDGHTFSEIPLLFQTEMVQAVLEDRKTKTRRTRGLNHIPLIDFDDVEYDPSNWPKRPWIFKNKISTKPDRFEIMEFAKCPYGKPGDLLWVRENFKIIPPNQLYFQADPENKAVKGWKPSIHMPKAACRIWLMVEKIRVERLQDITEEDAVAEGVEKSTSKGYCRMFSRYENTMFKYYLPEKADGVSTLALDARTSFESLWKSINGPQSWNLNPWVWVVKFRVLSKTGRPSDEVILENWKEVTNE